MSELNIYYNKNTNTWWINKNIDGFSLRKYINEYPVGLGTIEFNKKDEGLISNLHKVSSVFIPSHIKQLNGITEEIEKNGFENAEKIGIDELADLLKDN